MPVLIQDPQLVALVWPTVTFSPCLKFSMSDTRMGFGKT